MYLLFILYFNKDFPQLTDLPNWKPENFDNYPPDNLSKYCPRLDGDGLDLLNVFVFSMTYLSANVEDKSKLTNKCEGSVGT